MYNCNETFQIIPDIPFQQCKSSKGASGMIFVNTGEPPDKVVELMFEAYKA